jgi:hypothetical protein
MQPPLNDLQRRARGQRGGRSSRGLPRRGDARTRLGRLHRVGPKRSAAQINAVNTMPAVDAAGLAEAKKGFRRVEGHRDLPELTTALRRELTPPRPRRPPLLAPPDALTRSGRPPKIYSGRDILQELGALRSGSGCWRPSSPGDHPLLGVQGWPTAS